MATYRELHGKALKTVTTNPSDDAAEGQIWFNSTDNTFKSAVPGQAWSSAGPLSTGRYLSGSLGTQTAGVQIAGQIPSGNIANVEHYNGTGWSEETNFPSAGSAMSGAGTQTAGIAYGGNTPSQTANAFDYNGTAWTSANSLPYPANNIASCGLAKTSVIGAVGRDGSSGNSGTNKSVTFDGTNFANGPNINTTRMFNNSSGAGTGTAALIVGGFIDPSPNAMTNCEEYDGSSWTATGALNVATGFASAFGIQTNAVAQTNGSNYVETEGYDGSTWTVLPNMSVSSPGGLYGSSAGSTGDAGWVSSMSPNYNATEEFNKSINTITAAAWSSGGNLNLGRHDGGNAGTKTAGLFFGGKVYPNVFKNESEEYDGTSWSEGNNLGTARMTSGAGTQTAGLAFGGTNGAPGSTGVQALTEEYDGSSWSESGDLSTARMNCGGAGLQTAAYAAGGIGSPNAINDLHEQYNGSTWSTSTAMNTARSNMGSVGTTTASLVFSGYTPPSYTFATTSEEWNGSSWTSGGTVLTARYGLGGFGSQTDAIGFAGATPPNNNSAVTEGYDGSTFSTRPSMSTARMQFAPSGSYNSGSDGMAVGGSNAGNPMYANTEEWSTETTELNVKTLTQS